MKKTCWRLGVQSIGVVPFNMVSVKKSLGGACVNIIIIIVNYDQKFFQILRGLGKRKILEDCDFFFWRAGTSSADSIS